MLETQVVFLSFWHGKTTRYWVCLVWWCFGSFGFGLGSGVCWSFCCFWVTSENLSGQHDIFICHQHSPGSLTVVVVTKVDVKVCAHVTALCGQMSCFLFVFLLYVCRYCAVFVLLWFCIMWPTCEFMENFLRRLPPRNPESWGLAENEWALNNEKMLVCWVTQPNLSEF